MRVWAVLIAGALWGRAAWAQVEVSLQPWPDSARAAVSLTFDDAYPSQVSAAMPLLEARGFRGTFYLIVDRLFQRGKYQDLPSAPIGEWQAAFRRGHEMGSHTWTHVGLDTAGVERLQEELRASKEALEALFAGARVTSLAYPFSRADARVEREAAVYYTTGRLGPALPGAPPYNDPATADLLGLLAFFLCTGETPQQWNEAVDQTRQGGGWLVEALHPLDEEGYCRVRQEDFAAHLDYLARLKGQIWVAPVDQVAGRLLQWRAASLQVEDSSAERVRLRLREAGLYEWQVGVTIAGDWEVVDSGGHRLPARAQEGGLRFPWPAGQEVVSLERVGSTAVAGLTWGQVKGLFTPVDHDR